MSVAVELSAPTEGWDEQARRRSRRVWAAIMLALNVDTCESVLLGRPVIACNLDGEVLRRALRGRRLPRLDSYIAVTAAMLDAVAEAGRFGRVIRGDAAGRIRDDAP
jgi:hypothetical protein